MQKNKQKSDIFILREKKKGKKRDMIKRNGKSKQLSQKERLQVCRWKREEGRSNQIKEGVKDEERDDIEMRCQKEQMRQMQKCREKIQ